ncbi:unnamed protein product [Rotaria sordida]|uniref:Uncharacterized protein n=1 Tax=Rotaria sordida TaxID=392033 RepID=A0A814T0H3_9BILA|nr:unnamed protein product [Rotaria sordida]CAF1363359.1 unnamed protein product [Rotaria sordida]CAF1466405.1 unnamed protein product [Rotaria sordida]CAF1594516.1 unnamed protein product [Rotaria sordida]CAF3961602.1 unnamed protein product [Rotaria sordida]
MLAPKHNGYTLPDVWDGYYQSTLVKFSSAFPPEQLKKEFDLFHPSLDNVHVRKAVFRSSKLEVHSGDHRFGDRRGTNFIALYVTKPSEFQFEPLLQDIQQRINTTRWIQTSTDCLHINVRLYPDAPAGTNELTWTWEKICKIGLPDKVARLPIDFYCSTLEIVPARRQCVQRYRETKSNKWWSGVTELDGQCSGCYTPLDNGKWNGACLECGQYERITPVWSIPYVNTFTLARQIEQIDLDK